MLNKPRARKRIEQHWQDSIIEEITEYIRIPNKSPLFDPNWVENGYMEDAVTHMVDWAEAQALRNMRLEVVRLEKRTPLIYIEIDGDGDGVVLLYGHLDKQPEMTGWRDGLGPWSPVLDNDRLYGRGGADDGYAIYGCLAAIGAVQEQGLPHANLRIIIESSEESGSPDLAAYIDHLAARIGKPDLVVCLDSGCGNYDQLWCTTSLRGLIGADLNVSVLTEGVHSGDASGIVPSSFRVLRGLLGRIEDELSGKILLDELHVPVPADRLQQAAFAAEVLGNLVYTKFPFAAGVQPVAADLQELIVNRTWRPALEITGQGGIPPLADAGNVLRPDTAVKLSLRVPPGCDVVQAGKALERILTDSPPHGASVSFICEKAAAGWNAPSLARWLSESLERASESWFGPPAAYMGEGGSIPFMQMLADGYPDAQFLVTGVLGPQSNAHGPNEFLHLPTAMKITGCVAEVLVDYYQWRQGQNTNE